MSANLPNDSRKAPLLSLLLEVSAGMEAKNGSAKGNIRGACIYPSDLCRIHVQIGTNRRGHSHDTALEEGLLADSHRSGQNEQTLLDRRLEALGTLLMVRLFLNGESGLGALFLVPRVY